MTPEPSKALKIFYCYAHEDIVLLNELEKHLTPLKRVRAITGWYDRKIQAGGDWALETEEQFKIAHIILLLLSPDFSASDNCYSQMEKALESHQTGKIHVIPILLRPLIWDTLPINSLQPLPHNRRAVTTWSNRDEAFEDVAQGIREIVRTLIPKHLLSLQDTEILYSKQVKQWTDPRVNIPPLILPEVSIPSKEIKPDIIVRYPTTKLSDSAPQQHIIIVAVFLFAVSGLCLGFFFGSLLR